MSNTQLSVREQVTDIRTRMLNNDDLKNALPDHIPFEKFISAAVTAIVQNPALLQCDRTSLFMSTLKCAADGLIPDGREAALVQFKGKVQYMPMVSGIYKKIRNSGDLKDITAEVVYENDQFDYELGDTPFIKHKPALSNRGKAIAVYATATTKDGGKYREVMSLEEIEKVRNVSMAKNSGPWSVWWDEMARKTVIRRLAKRLPMSTDQFTVVARDDDMYELDQPRRRIDVTPGKSRLAAVIEAAEQEHDEPQQSEPEPVDIIEDVPNE